MSSGNPETRRKILRAAWALLEEAEGREVRMSDIAKSAGVSRQALYLHFPARADLLVATTLFIDEEKDVNARLARSRAATSGTERLDAFIDAWGNYIPEIYGVATALMAMSGSDEAAKTAWDGRLRAIREGCQAAVDALAGSDQLSERQSPEQATDLLWTLLSVRNWEQLTRDCGWPQALYVEQMKAAAMRLLVKDTAAP